MPDDRGFVKYIVALLFKDGFSISDLVDIFSLSIGNIEEHLRGAMFKEKVPASPLLREEGKAETPAPIVAPAATRVQTPKRVSESAKTGCAKHPNSPRYKNGQCRECALAYQRQHEKEKRARKMSSPAADPAPVPSKRPKKKRQNPSETYRPADTAQPADDAEISTATSENEDTFRRIAEATRRKRSAESNSPPVQGGVAAPSVSGDFVHSKPLTCPKCGSPHIRLRRRREADIEKDYWICPFRMCQLKISNYSIKVDTGYQEAAAAAGA